MFVMQKRFIDCEIDHGIARLYFCRPPVNALSAAFRTQLYDTLKALIEDDAIQGIICLTRELPFSAGADIKEFSKGMQGRGFMDLYAVISQSKKPIVCGIRHYALGGGLEFAMLCHYRVALRSAKLGQPEIKLGIIPGGTGTQSLPRLVGVELAIRMMLSGEPIDAKTAYNHGLLDQFCEDSLEDGCLQFMRKVISDPVEMPLLRQSPDYDEGFFEEQYQAVSSKSYGFAAPKRILDCVHAACHLSLEKGLAYEQKQFFELVTGPESSGMRYLFMQEHLSRHVQGVDMATAMPINSVGIVGGGLMGSGIAITVLSRGLPVILVEMNEACVTNTQERINRYFAQQVTKSKITIDQQKLFLDNLKIFDNYQCLADCDLIIEAVYEDITVKKSVLTKISAVCKTDAMIASNTSALDMNVLAACTKKPENFCGLHFFSPAPLMRLLEVVRASKTDAAVLASVLNFSRTIKKIPVVVGVCPGFVGNRMVIRYFQQVEYLLLRGVKPQEIDQAMTDFGFAMGPCQMADMSGLDICKHMIPGDTLAAVMVAASRLGQKNSAGFYNYESGSNLPIHAPEVVDMIATYASEKAIEPETFTQAEIVDRCMMALIHEGFSIIAEKIVERGGDIDLVYVYGYGFPSYRGGPMFYADQMGLKTVLNRIKNYQKEDPGFWKIHPLLERCVKMDKKISQMRSA